MTTMVKVIAHAGWPVDVTPIDAKSGAPIGAKMRVEAGQEATYYVHASQDLRVHEVQPDAAIEPALIGPFGAAIDALKAGRRVCRTGWNGKGMWLELQTPDAHSKMTLPYIYMTTADGFRVPWLASQTDMLSIDWMLVE